MPCVNVSGVFVENQRVELIGRICWRRVLLCGVEGDNFSEALTIEPDYEGEPWSLLKVYRYTPYVHNEHVIYYCWNDYQRASDYKGRTLVVYRGKDRLQNRGFVLFLENSGGSKEFLAAWFNRYETAPSLISDIVKNDEELLQRVREIGFMLNWRVIDKPHLEILYGESYKLLHE